MKRTLTLTLTLLALMVMLGSVTVMAQEVTEEPPIVIVEEGGDSSLIEVVRAEIQPLSVAVVIMALGIGLWAIVLLLREVRKHRKPELTFFLDGIEVIVKATPTDFDDKFYFFLRRLIEADEAPTIKSIRDKLLDASQQPPLK